MSPVAGAETGAAIGSTILPGVGTVVGGVIGGIGGFLIVDQLGNLIFPKPGNESRPIDAPTGTKPIDQVGLGRGDMHDIKNGIRAGPKDWVDVTPDGRIVTSTRMVRQLIMAQPTLTQTDQQDFVDDKI